MALEPINYGAAANDGTGDSLREAMRKSRANFEYLDQGKVDKVAGMGLSSNNFTNEERVKLANIQAQATKNLSDAVLLERSNQTGGFNGFGAMNDMRDGQPFPASSPPSAFFGKGCIKGFADGAQLGLNMAAGSYGVVECNSHWSDVSGFWATSRSFITGFGKHYECYAVSPGAWSQWYETSVSTAIITAATMKEFLQAMWDRGSGFYRNDAPPTGGVISQQYSAGIFSKTADTWTFISASYATGVPLILAGGRPDIDTGAWHSFTFGTAATRNAQTTVNDPSQGALMLTGAFGLGGSNATGGMNLNNADQYPLGTSFFYVNGADNGPFASFYGYLTVEKISGTFMIQTIKASGDGVVYKRHVTDGVFTPWLVVIDSKSAIGNIASGAIIERGTNANGQYTKYADGTLICRVARKPSFANVSNLLMVWTFPHAYVETPNVHTNVMGTTLQVSKPFLDCAYGIDSNGASVACLNTGSFVAGDADLVTLQATAIGRWK